MLHWTYKGWNCFSTIEIIMLQYELPTNHWWKFKEKNLLLHTTFPTVVLMIFVVVIVRKVFPNIKAWMIGQNPMKIHYQRERIFTATYKEYITDRGHMHPKKILKLKNLDEYCNLYVQSDTLLQVELFNYFGNMCIEIYELNSADFFLARISLASSSKKEKKKIAFLPNINILLKKCHVVNWYTKAKNKYMKEYDKKIQHILSNVM